MIDIIFVALVAVLAGCENAGTTPEQFGHTIEAWLRGFVPLEKAQSSMG